jgi:NitT/TauT family transport system permease protein
VSEPRVILNTAAAMNDGMDQPEVERQLSVAERLWNNAALRKGLILVVLAVIWEFYARHLDNVLLFPTLLDTLKALFNHLVDGSLLDRVWTSLKVLLIGYAAGIALAGILTSLAINTQIGTDLLETLTAMFNPLPAIALLPLALIWFGLGTASLVFVLVHSVMWAVALNTHAGFLSVSPILRMVGRNYGLRGLSYVFRILVPAAFSIDPDRLEGRLGVCMADADRG